MGFSDASLEFVLCNKYYIVVASVLIYLIKGYYDSFYHLRDFKGPWAAKFTELWFARASFGPSQHLVTADICEKYGTIARLGPNTLVTTSPELIMRMSGVRSPYSRSGWYEGVQVPPGKDNIFSQRDEGKHLKRRAQMAEGYGGKMNPSLEPSVSLHVQNFMDLIRRKYISTNKEFQPMDFARKVSFFTMDVITDIAFGQPFGNLVDDIDHHGYLQFNNDFLPRLTQLTLIPAARALMRGRLGALMFPGDKSETGIGKVIGVAKELVRKRYAMKDSELRKDMLSSFIAHGLTESDLLSESFVQILAGTDTSATTIRTVFLYAMTNPRVYIALQNEIDGVLESGLVHGDDIVEFAVAKELPYLQAVIQESLRILPPLTAILSKTSPPEGDTVTLASGEEVHIPAGVDIGQSNWGMMRNKDIFGVDVDVFRPERWLGAAEEQEKIAYMGKVVDLIFGYGKYQCLGRNVAWLEIYKITFELMRHFDWEIVDPGHPWRNTNSGLWLQTEMWVKITERKAVA